MAVIARARSDVAVGAGIGGLFLLASAAWCFVSGRDLSFDFFAYHLYGPYLLLEGRFDRDYFGGGLAGYLNPLVHVPLYLMIRAGWHSLVIAGVLTAVHSVNLLLAWKICDVLVPRAQPSRIFYLVGGTMLAFLSPIYLVVLGTSSADPLTSVPVLAGSLLLLREYPMDRWGGRRFAVAGFLLGLAVGLKLSNGLFAVVATIALLPMAGRRDRYASLFLLVLGGLAGGLLAHGYWSYMLWREFGNPLFPMANNLFRSQDFPPVMFHDRRFLQGGIGDLLTLPLRMLEYRTTVYSEIVCPDVRPLMVFVLAAAVPLVERLRRRQLALPASSGSFGSLGYMTAVFVACFVLWAAYSRIGRYALPLWLLAGPLIAAWTARLLTPRRGLLLLAAVCLVQGIQLYYAGNLRYTPTRWHSKWLDVRVPDRLRQSPYLYIVLGQQSWGAIIPYFHPDSSFSNIVGHYVMPGGDRIPGRLRSLLERHSGRTKVVFEYRDGHLKGGALSDGIAADVNDVLSAYNLQLKGNQGCDIVEIRFDHVKNWIVSLHESAPDAGRQAADTHLLVCDIRPGRSDGLAGGRDTASRQVDRAFDAVEKACPQLFSPSGMQTIHGRRGWARFYFNSVNRLMSDGNNLYVRPFSSLGAVNLGSLGQWLAENPPHHCEDAVVNANPFIR